MLSQTTVIKVAIKRNSPRISGCFKVHLMDVLVHMMQQWINSLLMKLLVMMFYTIHNDTVIKFYNIANFVGLQIYI